MSSEVSRTPATCTQGIQLLGARVPGTTLATAVCVILLGAALVTLPLSAADHPASAGSQPATATTEHALITTPVNLAPNRGQWGPSIRYSVAAEDYEVAFGARGVLLHRTNDAISETANIHFIGANPAPTQVALTGPEVNDEHAADPQLDAVARAGDAVTRFAYRGIYPGVDVVFYVNTHNQLAYDFVVAADTDIAQIALEYRGADQVQVDEQGNVQLALADAPLTMQAPRVFLADDVQANIATAQLVADERDIIRFSTP